MIQKRIIPVLLLSNKGLVKSINFKDNTYIGDPINAVRIFNEKEVDEIILLDINASKTKSEPQYKLIEEIGSEAFIPFAYGGGITNMQMVKKIMYAGAEKVVLNSIALKDPDFITQVSEHVGSSSTVVALDVKKNIWGKYKVFEHLKGKMTEFSPIEYAQKMESLGAGEIFINSVDADGTMKGYDLNLIKLISNNLSVPVVACGGAGNLTHIKELFNQSNADAAAGSLFIYQGKHKAVLINYPTQKAINETYG